MVNPITVSVIIPCFNHGRYVLEAVDSVMKVARDDIELIIVDDGSTDEETKSVFDELARRSFKVIKQDNKGLSAARNAGIRIAQGEFILPLDSDNKIRSSYLDAGLDLIRSDNNIGVVYGDLEYFGEKSGIYKVPDFDFIELTRGNYIDACALYRKYVWTSVQGYDEQMKLGWEDWDFWLRVAMQFEFRRLPKVTHEYRVRNDSMLKTTNCHKAELIDYIFKKSENRVARYVREDAINTTQSRDVEASLEYRIGRALLSPVRRIRNFVHAR